MTDPTPADEASPEESGAAAVLRNRPFLILWLSQLATQIGVNMILYGLTVVVLEATDLKSAVSGLFLTFLVPSVLFSAVAGVYVDRIDRRVVLVVSNILRGAVLVGVYAVGNNVALVLVLNANILHGADGRDCHPSPRRAFASIWGGPDVLNHCPPQHAVPSFAETMGHEVPHGARIGDYPQAYPIGWHASIP